MIALPGEAFTVIQKHSSYIYEVTTAAYPVKNPLYVDGRFLQLYDKKPLAPSHRLLLMNEILSKMESLIGLPYIWGGNYSQGIDLMRTLYPLQKNKTLTPIQESNWVFKGVDCSGMLYEATQGYAPRNSSWLTSYGEGLAIEGLSNEAIKQLLKPLDMIIWHGHVLFVLDKEYTIESRSHRGCVFITKISERLEQIKAEEKKLPMNSSKTLNYRENGFVIRRWHPGA